MMCKFVQENQIDAIISLGDNVYDGKRTYGRKSRQTFPQTFKCLNCPWCPIVGIHDYFDNPVDQMLHKDERWH